MLDALRDMMARDADAQVVANCMTVLQQARPGGRPQAAAAGHALQRVARPHRVGLRRLSRGAGPAAPAASRPHALLPAPAPPPCRCLSSMHAALRRLLCHTALQADGVASARLQQASGAALSEDWLHAPHETAATRSMFGIRARGRAAATRGVSWPQAGRAQSFSSRGVVIPLLNRIKARPAQAHPER